jgi:ribosome biogenesis GTPase A
MEINWYPGHMTKSMRMIEEQVKLVDAIVYVLDSRAPMSCINPQFDKFIGAKPTVYLLNKADLCEKTDVDAWKTRLKGENKTAIAVDSTSSGSSAAVVTAIKQLCADKINKLKGKGVNATVRAMILGVPNTGKSTLCNNLCGKAKAITGNRAGVTRGKQWVRVSDYVEVLDTPGTLYPKLSDNEVAKKLAYIGSIKDEVVDSYELAIEFIKDIVALYPDALKNRYGISDTDSPRQCLEEIAKRRGFIVKGGEADAERAAVAVIDDFRKGRLGKLTLEKA